MKRTLFFLFISTTLYAQNSTLIGIVLVNDNIYSNVKVKNLTSCHETITDINGKFKIVANVKDSLLFYSPQLIDLKYEISDKDFESTKFKIIMQKKYIELEEVIINGYPEINAYSLGITQKKIKSLSSAERKLKVAGDFKYKDLISILAGSLKIDPIINSLNGKTEKLKKELQIEKKESNLQFLKNNYYEYLNKTFKINDDIIMKIFYYAIEDIEFEKLKNNNEKEKIKFFLCDIKNKLK